MEDVHWTNQCTGGAWSAANDQASSCGSGGEQQRDTSIHQTKHHLSLSVVRAAMLILDLPGGGHSGGHDSRVLGQTVPPAAGGGGPGQHRLLPLSVALALGMVELGARGASLEEIRQAVGFSHLLPGVEFSLLQNLTAALSEDNAHYVIRFANSLLLQEGITFNPEFLHLMKKYFQADVETVDFSESAAVADQIKHLGGESHREGSWKNQFRPENTRTFSFSRDDGSEVQTLMMYQQGDFYYGRVLEMPYEGEDMSMLIVLPRQEVPLASLEPIFKAALLEEWANNVKRQKVEVYMPRFKVEQKIDLRSTLQDLGIKNIFTNDADLSAMTDGKDLHIGKAVQKAYLEVTEEGAEGAVGS
ncbi:hypothetical protein F7725_021041, partial [Dissostichus mawsoni]